MTQMQRYSELKVVLSYAMWHDSYLWPGPSQPWHKLQKWTAPLTILYAAIVFLCGFSEMFTLAEKCSPLPLIFAIHLSFDKTYCKRYISRLAYTPAGTSQMNRMAILPIWQTQSSMQPVYRSASTCVCANFSTGKPLVKQSLPVPYTTKIIQDV